MLAWSSLSEAASSRYDAKPATARAQRKVAHIVRQYSPSIGGLEAYVHELAARQAQAEPAYIITLNRVFGSRRKLPRFERQGRILIIRIGFVGSRRFFVPFLSSRLLRRFSILHVHGTDQLLDLVAGFSRAFGIPFVVTTHGLFFHTRRFQTIKRVYLRLLTRHSLAQSAAIFAVSENDRQTVRSIGLEPVLLRNPIVPLGTFIAEGIDLLYIGRIAENKRVDDLLRFATEVIAHDPNCRLHIVGSDPDGRWNQLSRSMAASAQDRVRFHGYLSRVELAPILRSSGFVVSASEYEGYGLSIVEGMSVGLLPVVHDNAAFRETVTLAGSGLLLNFRQPEKAALQFLEWRKTITRDDREKAARYAHSQSWASGVALVEQSYERVLGARHARH